MKVAVLSAAVLTGAVAQASAQPALAFDHVVSIQGQTFWKGDPGTADPGTFFDSGQYRFTPIII
jgi:hypothetical protein